LSEASERSKSRVRYRIEAEIKRRQFLQIGNFHNSLVVDPRPAQPKIFKAAQPSDAGHIGSRNEAVPLEVDVHDVAQAVNANEIH
jgi:hypothetical protein